MESCSYHHKAIEATVGTLVWVRHRNGSWWPGRVVGSEELPEMCSLTKKLGTPVKILGRDGTRVNWYNFEKSKRVKAFRCCEFDKCIRNAKSSAGQITKTGAKYVCRDDAILQALRLESRHESNCSDQFCVWKEASTGRVADESDSVKGLSRSTISFETSDHMNESNEGCVVQKKKEKALDDSEDDSIEGSKRMRDLEDIGMQLVPVEKSDGLHDVIPDSGSLSGSNIHSTISIGSPVNSSKSSPLFMKRQHSQNCNHVTDCIKRKRRRRPIRKVLESTAKVDAHTFSNQEIKEVKICGLDSWESKVSLDGTAGNNSDPRNPCERDIISLNNSIYTVDFVIDVTVLQDAELLDELNRLDKCYRRSTDMSFLRDNQTQGTGSYIAQSSQVGSMQSNNKACDAIRSTDTPFTHHTAERVDKYITKFQVKKQMNLQQSTTDKNFREVIFELNGYSRNDNCSFDDSIPSDSCTQHRKRQTSGMLSMTQESSFVNGIATQERPFEEFHRSYLQPMHTGLYNVPLDVQATYKGRHVPLISLTSKLDGKAIVGHPIAVDVSTEGFSDILEANMAFRHASTTSKICNFHPKNSRSFNSVVSGIQVIAEMGDSNHLACALQKSTPEFEKYGLLDGNTGKLSSTAVGHERGKAEKKSSKEKLSSLFVTCVPLKEAFRRITEDLS